MADEKKSPEFQSNEKTIEQIIFLLAIFIILGVLANALLNFINNLGLSRADTFWGRIVAYFLDSIWPTWKLVAIIISLFSLVGIIYNSWKLRAINIEEMKIFDPSPEVPTVDILSSTDEKKKIAFKNDKWQTVLNHMNSSHTADWRLAIIEADVMLEEVLRALGYPGDSVGEMLKSTNKNEFSTLDEAWEAHKVRNAIAHSGADFPLNERETKHTIGLFEKVFQEFGVI